jgi:hypothetical protein
LRCDNRWPKPFGIWRRYRSFESKLNLFGPVD